MAFSSPDATAALYLATAWSTVCAGVGGEALGCVTLCGVLPCWVLPDGDGGSVCNCAGVYVAAPSSIRNMEDLPVSGMRCPGSYKGIVTVARIGVNPSWP